MIADMQRGTIRTYNIVGVVKDFHFETMHQNITPLCFVVGNNTYSMSFKIDASEAKNVIAQLEKNWKAMAGGNPFSYRFLDEAFNNMYRAEMRMSKIVLIFSMLTILVACLGLFGLANFVAEQRTKEIGIRKVLGADVSKLVGMLSKDFMKLVLISFVIAFPIAWWFMNLWLQDFVYRINISWGVFILAGLLTSFIALVTISFQTIKAAIANPVKSLRTE